MNRTLKERVLALSQEEIYSLYFEIPVTDINWSASTYKNKLSNPYREDSDPSLSFAWYGDKLIVRDFADQAYSGDIFKVCGYIMNMNYMIPAQFVEICNNIISKYKKEPIFRSNEHEILAKQKSVTKIDVKFRNLQKRDYDYFRRYCIKDKVVDNMTQACMRYSINDYMTNYRNDPRDPCYVYTVNTKFTKLYFPNRLRHSDKPRFITNNLLPIDDITSVRPCNDILIVKSIKDKMLCIQMLESLSINDICIQTASSETSAFPVKVINLLKSQVQHNIYDMFDADIAGIKAMELNELQYGIKPLLFSYTAKDPTDFAKAYGYNKTIKTFKEHIEYIISNRITINNIK